MILYTYVFTVFYSVWHVFCLFLLLCVYCQCNNEKNKTMAPLGARRGITPVDAINAARLPLTLAGWQLGRFFSLLARRLLYSLCLKQSDVNFGEIEFLKNRKTIFSTKPTLRGSRAVYRAWRHTIPCTAAKIVPL